MGACISPSSIGFRVKRFSVQRLILDESFKNPGPEKLNQDPNPSNPER
jgi:hypothetical protein